MVLPETLARLIAGRVTCAQSVWARCNLEFRVIYRFDDKDMKPGLACSIPVRLHVKPGEEVEHCLQ